VKKTQIQLDDDTYAALRRRAYDEHRSISSVVRDALGEALGTKKKKGRKRLTVKDFPFVGVGRTRQGRIAPVSERHDEALAKAFLDAHRK
jgi:plasmid stability protein